VILPARSAASRAYAGARCHELGYFSLPPIYMRSKAGPDCKAVVPWSKESASCGQWRTTSPRSSKGGQKYIEVRFLRSRPALGQSTSGIEALQGRGKRTVQQSGKVFFEDVPVRVAPKTRRRDELIPRVWRSGIRVERIDSSCLWGGWLICIVFLFKPGTLELHMDGYLGGEVLEQVLCRARRADGVVNDLLVIWVDQDPAF